MDYTKAISGINLEDLVSVDESGTNISLVRLYIQTDLYRDTRNIRLVQKALEHSDLSTTMVYTHIHDQELESAMKSFRVRSRE